MSGEALLRPEDELDESARVSRELFATAHTIEVLSGGTASVFALARAGETRPRRYVATFEPGDALFVTAPPADGALRLVAFPMGDVSVDRRPFASLASSAGDEGLERLLETWVRRLGGALASLPLPFIHSRIAAGERVEASAGRALEPSRGLSWLAVRRGRARWMGLNSVEVDEASGPLPMSEGLWLEAVNDIEVEALSTGDVARDPVAVENGLALLARGLLEGLVVVEANERRQKDRQLHEKQRRSRRVAVVALTEMASVLRTNKVLPEEGSPLFLATSAVGQALGVSIRPPGKSEELHRLLDPIEAIAHASGVRTRSVLLTPGWWREDVGPLVGTIVEGARPVALLPGWLGRYSLLDPSTGRRVRVGRAVADSLAPSAVTLYRPLPEGVLSPGQVLRFSAHGRMGSLWAMVAVGLLGALIGMATPLVATALIDLAIPAGDRGLMLELLLALAGCAVAVGALQVSQGILSLRLRTAADHDLNAAIWDRLLRLRLSFFRRFSTGDLETRVTAIRQMRRVLSGTVVKTLLTSTLALLNFALLMWWSSKLALAAAVLFVLQLVATTTVSLAIRRQNRDLAATQGALFGFVVQLVGGIPKLRVTGSERRAFAHWAKTYAHQQKTTLWIKSLQDGLVVWNTLLTLGGSAVIFYGAAPSNGASTLSTGAFVGFTLAFAYFLAGATNLSEAVTSAIELINLGEHASEILAATPEVDSSKVDPGPLVGRIRLDQVVFRYGGVGPATIDGVSLHADPGEFVALVGESGSGKSTLLKLALGFESPESGTIHFDDRDLARLDLGAVRRQIGVVLQSERLTSGSVFEIIANGRAITLAEAQEAVRHAGLLEELAAMPMGLHTIVSEGGTTLSGGQRQRLMIARAIVTKPRVLLFDEATSALDNRTQSIVNQSLEALRVTRIVVAHRLSTIRNATRIYVIDKGRVAQSGTFAELAREKGTFARLLARQRP